MRPILPVPHPLLDGVSLEITEWNDHLATLCRELQDTATQIVGPCASLSAVQIGSPTRVIFIGSGLTEGDPMILINPKMMWHGTLTQVMSEGCVSMPGIEIKVQRYATIDIEARRPNGDDAKFRASGVMAQALQHELNHLDGKTLADCCNRTKRNFIRENMKCFGGHIGKLLQYDVRA
jgi:peptide deformylase